ncbi:MAG: hypothetical protein K2R93_21025 [Gemmatimonadaceae bacterium]|nr:hypothetical protein [Gemmatimonadaceae bacterium]
MWLRRARFLWCGLLPLSTLPAQMLDAPRATALPRAVLDSMLRAELLMQRDRWQAEEIRVHGPTRHPQQTEPEMQRLALMHCHTDRFYAPSASLLAVPRGVQSMQRPAPPYPLPTFIASTAYKTAMCPSWAVATLDDSPLSGPRHLQMTSAPAQAWPFSDDLVMALDRAAQADPNDAWATSQLTRVLTENGDTTRALAATERCAPSRVPWCAVLHAYATYSAGQWPAAQRAYRSAMTLLDQESRCRYRDATLLLPPADAEVYNGLPCAIRDTVDATLWWLSTPLFSDGANLRALEHFARVVRLELVSALPFDAHHDLRRETGGDAIAEMRVRYGWPQHQFYTGAEEDRSHWRYQEANNAPPFPVAEYSRLNIPSVVSWRAVLKPNTVSDADYPWAPTRLAARTNTPMAAERAWWPREFFLHPRGLMARLPEPQHVVLRRDSAAVLLVGATLPAGTEGEAMLLLAPTTEADAVLRLDRSLIRRGTRVVLRGTTPRAGLASVEVLPAGGGSLRSRFLVAAEAMRPLAPNSCAMSPPVLLDAAAIQRRGAADVDDGLLGSTRLVRPGRLGVAWESYGIRERDTVTISLRIAGAATQTRMEQMGRLLHVGTDPRVGLTMRWTEPNPSYLVTPIEARIPTLLRELTVDLSALRSGAYRLEISMERAGCAAVTSQRAFTVVR